MSILTLIDNFSSLKDNQKKNIVPVVQTCSSNPCFQGVQCYDDPVNGFQCGSCPTGFTGDGIRCEDIDECRYYNPCDPRTNCINTVPGFYCEECPTGFYGEAIRGWGLEQVQQLRQVIVMFDVKKKFMTNYLQIRFVLMWMNVKLAEMVAVRRIHIV